jgi:hypothetical protein
VEPQRAVDSFTDYFRKTGARAAYHYRSECNGVRADIGFVSGDESLSHRAYFPIFMMACTIAVGSAHAQPDEPSVVMATGDFNRDGIADMVEATSPDGKSPSEHFLTVRLGRADGTYTSVASHNVIGSDARGLAVGDFNADGNLDVIVGRGDGAILEFVGDGRGKMTNAGNVATLGSIASMAVGHFTRSGNLDVVVSDFRSNSAVVLLGAGDGTFRLTWSFQLPRRGKEFHIATADFNKDGIADLVITNEDDEDYEVMLGSGSGTFTEAPELSHFRDPNTYCPS